MTRARCCDCGAPFVRGDDEAWKVRCLPCWVRLKQASEATQREPDPLRDEVSAHMRALLMLCHPDKHGNSTLATRTTQWLLGVRNRLTGGAKV